MADKPILFSGPMVRALLDGRKTQTRRVLKPQPRRGATVFQDGPDGFWYEHTKTGPGSDCVEVDAVEPGYEVGDRLWVRENFHLGRGYDGAKPKDAPPHARVWFAADGSLDNCDAIGKLRPNIFLPRWASRLTLIVTEVRVQRVQEISEEDAEAEGVGPLRADGRQPNGLPASDAFAALWDSLNASRGYGWDANPFVVAVTFECIRKNIDEVVCDQAN